MAYSPGYHEKLELIGRVCIVSQLFIVALTIYDAFDNDCDVL